MLSVIFVVACLVRHAVAAPLLSRRADGPQPSPAPGAEIFTIASLADLCVIVSAAVLVCTLLGLAIFSYIRRGRRRDSFEQAVPRVFEIDGLRAPCASASRQRKPSKLFDDLIRAVNAAQQAASCMRVGLDPSLRRKSVASGIIYDGVPSTGPQQGQRRSSLAVLSS